MRHSFLLLIISVLFLSCKSRKPQETELEYMKNIEQVALDASLQNSRGTLQPGDHLMIWISAKDMDVTKPFNQNYSSGGEIQQYSVGSTNIINQGQVTAEGPTYIVDNRGDIDFPVIGRLNTSNKTIEAFKDELRQELSRYIKNPVVTMKITNYRVTLLGEVNRPGTYVIPDGQSTLLNALGLAGDLTIYGRRDNVLVVRNIDGNITKERINLQDANFINSPYYYLRQGDVVSVSSNETREKTAKLDPNINIYIAVAGVVIAAAGILVTVLKK